MPNVTVVSPKCTSESAKWLVEYLGCDYHNPYAERKFNYREYDTVINYGVSEPLTVNHILNHPESIRISVNKLATFSRLKDKVPMMLHTQNKEEAREWLRQGHWVVIRSTLVGHRSEGTTITENESDLDSIPGVLYTMYIPHTNEFRVNCYKGKILSVLDKVENNGNFEFKLLRKSPHPHLDYMAKTVYEQTKLDIAGIDVLLTEDNQLCFLEVNSGPALFGTTSLKLGELLKKELYA